MLKTEKEKALDMLFVRIEKISWNLNRTLGINGGASFNIEELKEKLKFEDLFYEIVLNNISKKTDTEISFNKDRVVFKRRK